MLLLGNMTNTFEATNFMSSFKVHNCYLQKILFDLQYVQINLIKSLYNRVLCLTYSCVHLVVIVGGWLTLQHVWGSHIIEFGGWGAVNAYK